MERRWCRGWRREDGGGVEEQERCCSSPGPCARPHERLRLGHGAFADGHMSSGMGIGQSRAKAHLPNLALRQAIPVTSCSSALHLRQYIAVPSVVDGMHLSTAPFAADDSLAVSKIPHFPHFLSILPSTTLSHHVAPHLHRYLGGVHVDALASRGTWW